MPVKNPKAHIYFPLIWGMMAGLVLDVPSKMGSGYTRNVWVTAIIAVR